MSFSIPLILLLITTVFTSSSDIGYPITSHEIQIQEESTAMAVIGVGQKLFLVVNLDNTLATQVNFTYVTEVIDSNGYTA